MDDKTINIAPINARSAGLARTSITNELADAINKMARAGFTYGATPPTIVGSKIVEAKITGLRASDSIGCYTADAFISNDIIIAEADSSSESQLGTKSTNAAIVFNFADIVVGASQLSVDDIVQGRIVGMQENSGKWVLFVCETRRDVMFPVKLTTDGGSLASATANLTYTVKTLKDLELETASSPFYRPFSGKLSAAATRGQGWYEGGTLYFTAYETYDDTEC